MNKNIAVTAKVKRKTSAKARLMTPAADSFFARARERARRLDRGERLPAQITVVFEDPSDLIRVLVGGTSTRIARRSQKTRRPV